MNRSDHVIIIGAGIIGIATGYYLARHHGCSAITLIDSGDPMGFTSAQSGENYRNWWPHPAMVAFSDTSIDLMEQLARDSGNQINMTRRGYALATRDDDIAPLLAQLHDGLQSDAPRLIRSHETAQASRYQDFTLSDWTAAPEGVDILHHPQAIRSHFPHFDPAVKHVIHIRRGGDISGQQLGSLMLQDLRKRGARLLRGTVRDIDHSGHFAVTLDTDTGRHVIKADALVNAAGPFAAKIAGMLGHRLPIQTLFQQKIAFPDTANTVPRQSPFCIDLDAQHLNWLPEERALLQSDPDHAWMADRFPGAIHCRPDGGDGGTWVKLGWAYNTTPAPPSRETPLDPYFPDIVLRGASRLNPALGAYVGHLPRNARHYGGWYSMTSENWPLIGPAGPDGSFVNGAMSGFGTMAACGAGALCAAWVMGAKLPDYARGFSLDRYNDSQLMALLYAANKGVL